MNILEDIYGMILFGRLCKFSAKCLFVSAVGILPFVSVPLLTGLYNQIDDTPQRSFKETMAAHAFFGATTTTSSLAFGALTVPYLLMALLRTAGIQATIDLQSLPGHALLEELFTLICAVWLVSVFSNMGQYLWLKHRARNQAGYQNRL